MDNIWLQSALWIGLALIASLSSVWLGDLGRAHRDRGGCARRQSHRPAPHRLAQLSRRLRRHSSDLPRRRRDRPARRAQAFLVDPGDRPHGLLRALSRRDAVRALRARLALAPGADRRHLAFDHLGRGRLCGDGRDRLQPDRDRQDHPDCVLRQRSRHGAGIGPRLRQLQHMARRLRDRHRDRPAGPVQIRAVVLRCHRQAGQRAGHQAHVPRAASGSAAWRASRAASRCCRPISSAW